MQCHATNKQGKQCGKGAVPGARVCRLHGGAAPQVREAARRRLLAAADPAAAELERQLRDKTATHADKRACAIAILDRAGLKPTDKIELSGPDGGPIQTAVDYSKFSSEELEWALKLAERLKAPETNKADPS